MKTKAKNTRNLCIILFILFFFSFSFSTNEIFVPESKDVIDEYMQYVSIFPQRDMYKDVRTQEINEKKYRLIKDVNEDELNKAIQELEREIRYVKTNKDIIFTMDKYFTVLYSGEKYESFCEFISYKAYKKYFCANFQDEKVKIYNILEFLANNGILDKQTTTAIKRSIELKFAEISRKCKKSFEKKAELKQFYKTTDELEGMFEASVRKNYKTNKSVLGIEILTVENEFTYLTLVRDGSILKEQMKNYCLFLADNIQVERENKKYIYGTYTKEGNKIKKLTFPNFMYILENKILDAILRRKNDTILYFKPMIRKGEVIYYSNNYRLSLYTILYFFSYFDLVPKPLWKNEKVFFSIAVSKNIIDDEEITFDSDDLDQIIYYKMINPLVSLTTETVLHGEELERDCDIKEIKERVQKMKELYKRMLFDFDKLTIMIFSKNFLNEKDKKALIKKIYLEAVLLHLHHIKNMKVVVEKKEKIAGILLIPLSFFLYGISTAFIPASASYTTTLLITFLRGFTLSAIDTGLFFEFSDQIKDEIKNKYGTSLESYLLFLNKGFNKHKREKFLTLMSYLTDENKDSIEMLFNNISRANMFEEAYLGKIPWKKKIKYILLFGLIGGILDVGITQLFKYIEKGAIKENKILIERTARETLSEEAFESLEKFPKLKKGRIYYIKRNNKISYVIQMELTDAEINESLLYLIGGDEQDVLKIFEEMKKLTNFKYQEPIEMLERYYKIHVNHPVERAYIGYIQGNNGFIKIASNELSKFSEKFVETSLKNIEFTDDAVLIDVSGGIARLNMVVEDEQSVNMFLLARKSLIEMLETTDVGGILSRDKLIILRGNISKKALDLIVNEIKTSNMETGHLHKIIFLVNKKGEISHVISINPNIKYAGRENFTLLKLIKLDNSNKAIRIIGDAIPASEEDLIYVASNIKENFEASLVAAKNDAIYFREYINPVENIFTVVEIYEEETGELLSANVVAYTRISPSSEFLNLKKEFDIFLTLDPKNINKTQFYKNFVSDWENRFVTAENLMKNASRNPTAHQGYIIDFLNETGGEYSVFLFEDGLENIKKYLNINGNEIKQYILNSYFIRSPDNGKLGVFLIPKGNGTPIGLNKINKEVYTLSIGGRNARLLASLKK